MKGHAFGQSGSKMQSCIKILWKKLDQFNPRNPDPVYIIGPVDQQSAPDHNRQHRKVDPVKPADGQRMFFLESFTHVLYNDYRSTEGNNILFRYSGMGVKHSPYKCALKPPNYRGYLRCRAAAERRIVFCNRG